MNFRQKRATLNESGSLSAAPFWQACDASGTSFKQLQISEFLTPAEVANILKVNVKTVVRRFEEFPGVVDLGTEETRFKRRYRVLRIPRETLEKFIVENRVV